jgi:hypothetical protein
MMERMRNRYHREHGETQAQRRIPLCSPVLPAVKNFGSSGSPHEVTNPHALDSIH